MNTRLRQYWQKLYESLWFVPALMTVLFFALAYGLVYFDAHTSWQGKKQFPLLFGMGADGSRGMLAAISGSMLTVATLAFSLTLSTISQVGNQYSPRVLREFMRDRVNQVVIGYFVGVFTYSLVVLGTIRSNDEGPFVPSTAVLTGFLFSLGGVAALIYFIHHIAESLQIGTIVQRVLDETTASIRTLFPTTFGEAIDDPHQVEIALRYAHEQTGWQPVRPHQAGYLQRINTDGLLRWAVKHQVVIQLHQRIGDFVDYGTLLFQVRNDMKRSATLTADWPDNLMDYVAIGRHRNIEQDVAFGIQQLVDIALKALSPGINDTTTAIMAVDYLGAILVQLAKREFPSRLRSDGHTWRVLVHTYDFDEYVIEAFGLICINAKGNHAVLRRLLRALAGIADEVVTPDRKRILHQQAKRVVEQADETLSTTYEKMAVRQVYAELKPHWS